MRVEIESCRLCPRQCGARRTETEGHGFCGMGALPVVARAALHPWEEPCISGEKGVRYDFLFRLLAGVRVLPKYPPSVPNTALENR